MNKIDTLNREPFVEKVYNLIETVSNNHGNTTFAINGQWGCGKSFVLDMLEEKLNTIQQPDTAVNKYFLIRYNSWKYDFYEEPLIAFVSAIIDILTAADDSSVSNAIKVRILDRLKKIGIGFLNIGNAVLKNKLGIDMQPVIEPLVASTKSTKKSADQSPEASTYDTFYAFKNQLDELRKTLSEIAKKQTIIIIVDELDRCLPEYAIKVLERLHHITEELPNTITVIATDKNKLTNTVKSIYGFADKDLDLYLKKFINFEILLSNGTNDENVVDKYTAFIQQFSAPSKQILGEYIKLLFKDISPREQEQLFEKTQIVHNLTTSVKLDASVLCAELFLVVMSMHYNIDILNGIKTVTVALPFNTDYSKTPLRHFESKIINAHYGQMNSFDAQFGARKLVTITNQTSVYGIVIWYVNQICDQTNSSCVVLSHDLYHFEEYYSNAKHIKNFANALKLIK